MGILMFPTFLVMFMFFALSLDAGISFFDHRSAQQQADAAAEAAIVFLPADPSDPSQAWRISDANNAANAWLHDNGSTGTVGNVCPIAGTGNGVLISSNWSDPGDHRLNTVQVCVRRNRPSLFASLSGVRSIYVSAGATAQVGEENSLYT